MTKSKEPIRLRKRLMPSGLTSLYLDIYVNGRRSYEYLRLYLVPEKNRADKEKNRYTLQLAEDVRAKRMVELRNGLYGFNNLATSDTLFFPFFRKCAKEREKKDTRGISYIWWACYQHLCKYEKNENVKFSDITTAWINGFKAYLDKAKNQKCNENIPLTRNSKVMYYSCLRTCIIQARKNGLLEKNPFDAAVSIQKEDTARMYLTLQELKALINTECESQEVRNAFLFSCFTGLRKSDIQRLTWEEVTEQGDFTRIVFKQKKTKGLEYLDISQTATELMRERKGAKDKIFALNMCSQTLNSKIQKWVNDAGIPKKITFHCARHTFAVMMLELDTDIYTVSKLLGHRNLNTTQIYAKVVDKKKQEAVSRIPNLLVNE